jgi:hypothetical protein
MTYTPIFSIAHIKLIKKLYLTQHLPPREVLRELNTKFNTAFTTEQLSAKLSESGLSKRRKLAKSHAALAATDKVSLGVNQRPELADIRAISAGHLKLGQTITAKAQVFAEAASSAKTLSSVASAARTGISIVRDVLGLNSTSAPSMNHSILTVNFAHSDESPFSPAGRERQRLAEMKRAEQIQEPPPVEIDGVSVNAESMDAQRDEAK